MSSSTKVIVVALFCIISIACSFSLTKLSNNNRNSIISIAPRVTSSRSSSSSSSCTALYGVGKDAKRAWAKGDLSDKDMFDDDVSVDDGKNKKSKFKLEPETVFFEGPPAISEVILPALSIFTVIGLIPFASAMSRQIWVRYKFTSRRISIQSGIGGKDQTEIIYPDVEEIRFVYRSFGSAGDMVLFLKDGAKVELRHVANFNEVYQYVISKCDEECQNKSMKTKLQTAN